MTIACRLHLLRRRCSIAPRHPTQNRLAQLILVAFPLRQMTFPKLYRLERRYRCSMSSDLIQPTGKVGYCVTCRVTATIDRVALDSVASVTCWVCQQVLEN